MHLNDLFEFSGSCRVVPSHISSRSDDGKFHGTESFLGVVAQQFQLGRAQIEERGKHVHLKLSTLLI